jgi:hypothetical protein
MEVTAFRSVLYTDRSGEARPPHPPPLRGTGNAQSFPRRERARVLIGTTKILRTPRQKAEGSGAPKGASSQCPRSADKCCHLHARGRGSAPKAGARSPSGAPQRRSPGLSHPGSAPGQASWDLVRAAVTRLRLSQPRESTSHLGRNAEGHDARNRPGAGLRSPRGGTALAPPVGTSPVTPPRVSKVRRCVTEIETDVKAKNQNVSYAETLPAWAYTPQRLAPFVSPGELPPWNLPKRRALIRPISRKPSPRVAVWAMERRLKSPTRQIRT